jgi:YVTN family beta-propeller protein
MCYDSVSDKLYCAAERGNCVTVIDGVTNAVIRNIQVGQAPVALAWDPDHSRIFVANLNSSSISALRDSMPGIEEGLSRVTNSKPAPAVVRGLLFLPQALGPKLQAARLLDASGRKVLDLKAGANDVSGLSTGVYFVQEKPQASSHKPRGFRKIVIAR